MWCFLKIMIKFFYSFKTAVSAVNAIFQYWYPTLKSDMLNLFYKLSSKRRLPRQRGRRLIKVPHVVHENTPWITQSSQCRIHWPSCILIRPKSTQCRKAIHERRSDIYNTQCFSRLSYCIEHRVPITYHSGCSQTVCRLTDRRSQRGQSVLWCVIWQHFYHWNQCTVHCHMTTCCRRWATVRTSAQQQRSWLVN